MKYIFEAISLNKIHKFIAFQSTYIPDCTSYTSTYVAFDRHFRISKNLHGRSDIQFFGKDFQSEALPKCLSSTPDTSHTFSDGFNSPVGFLTVLEHAVFRTSRKLTHSTPTSHRSSITITNYGASPHNPSVHFNQQSQYLISGGKSDRPNTPRAKDLPRKSAPKTHYKYSIHEPHGCNLLHLVHLYLFELMNAYAFANNYAHKIIFGKCCMLTCLMLIMVKIPKSWADVKRNFCTTLTASPSSQINKIFRYDLIGKQFLSHNCDSIAHDKNKKILKAVVVFTHSFRSGMH